MSSTIATQLLGNSATKKQKISTRLKGFKIITKLSLGSNNDGTGSINKLGLVIGKKYEFNAINQFSSIYYPSGGRSHIVWELSYRDLRQNKVIVLPKRYYSVMKLDLSEETLLDMAGRTITIKCYESTNPSNYFL